MKSYHSIHFLRGSVQLHAIVLVCDDTIPGPDWPVAQPILVAHPIDAVSGLVERDSTRLRLCKLASLLRRDRFPQHPAILPVRILLTGYQQGKATPGQRAVVSSTGILPDQAVDTEGPNLSVVSGYQVLTESIRSTDFPIKKKIPAGLVFPIPGVSNH